MELGIGELAICECRVGDVGVAALGVKWRLLRCIAAMLLFALAISRSRMSRRRRHQCEWPRVTLSAHQRQRWCCHSQGVWIGAGFSGANEVRSICIKKYSRLL